MRVLTQAEMKVVAGGRKGQATQSHGSGHTADPVGTHGSGHGSNVTPTIS